MAPTSSVLSASVYLRSHASIAGKHVNVGMMTSGGLAPCLSSSVAQLAKYWIQALEEGKIAGLTLRMYVDGYAGVLTGHSFVVPESEWKNMEKLNFLGGSPIGNSRVKVSHRNRRKDDVSALLLGFQICQDKFSTWHVKYPVCHNIFDRNLNIYYFPNSLSFKTIFEIS